MLDDNKSTNGTYVNGRKITSATQLADGDAVPVVVAAQSAGDAGDEGVVESPAAAVRGLLQLGQGHLVHRKPPHHGAVLHQR